MKDERWMSFLAKSTSLCYDSARCAPVGGFPLPAMGLGAIPWEGGVPSDAQL